MLLAKSKLNSTKNISKSLKDGDIIHEEFTLVSKEVWNYVRLKEDIRMRNSRRDNIEKVKLMECSKRIGINEMIAQNERASNSLKSQVQI